MFIIYIGAIIPKHDNINLQAKHTTMWCTYNSNSNVFDVTMAGQLLVLQWKAGLRAWKATLYGICLRFTAPAMNPCSLSVHKWPSVRTSAPLVAGGGEEETRKSPSLATKHPSSIVSADTVTVWACLDNCPPNAYICPL